MALFARIDFDDEDPEIHARPYQHARALLDDDPAEFVRVQQVLADSLRDYAARVDADAAKLGDRLEHEAAARAQLGRDQHPADQPW
ncbi:hypothetical protein [Cellulomonas sp. URHB0016]